MRWLLSKSNTSNIIQQKHNVHRLICFPAFLLTPFTACGVDEEGFSKILACLTAARVDSLGIRGSTESYAYLTREQRNHIATLAKQLAEDIPVMVCVWAVSTDAILHLADDAQTAGADALLFPAISYQSLRDGVFYPV